jgi:hypothetical protein
MKRILVSMAREFKLIFRDGITIYLTISPAALALLFMIVFGSVQKSSVSLAVDRGLPPDMTSKLEAVADLEYTDGLEDLENRGERGRRHRRRLSAGWESDRAL